MGTLHRALGVSLLSLTLSAMTANPVIAAPSSAADSTAAAIANIRIGNFGKIDDSYYRGAQPKGRDYSDLAALGVKTVIDLQADGDPSEARLVEKAGMKYVRIAMTTHVVPTVAQLTQFLSLVGDPANGPVYVHCAGGRHRTGVMTAVYRMAKGAWTAKKAFAEMKDFHFGFDFLHPEFKRFVMTFDPKVLAAAAATAATAAAN